MKKLFILLGVIMFCILSLGCNKENLEYLDRDNEDVQRIIKLESQNSDSGIMKDIPPNNLYTYAIYMNFDLFILDIKEENFYYVCAYGSDNLKNTRNKFIKMSFVKYNKDEMILEKIKNKSLKFVYVIFDSYITKDIISKEDYNVYKKYYKKINYNFENLQTVDLVSNKYIIWSIKSSLKSSEFYITDSILMSCYPIDDTDKENLQVVFPKGTYENGVYRSLKDELGPLYERLIEHVVDNDRFRETKCNKKGECYVIEKFGINIDVFAEEILKEINKEHVYNSCLE